MRNRKMAGVVALSALLFLSLFLAPAATPYAEQATALDRYVAKKDPSYSWKLVSTLPGSGFKQYVLDFASQTWRSAAEVDRPVWKHWLTIVKPDRVAHDKGLLFIGGGSNRDAAPSSISERASGIAVDTGSVVAELGMVPNQPLFFSD